MTRPYNFSAGPANLSEEVLQQAAAGIPDWRGSGMNVVKTSHRGKDFAFICEHALADFRELISTPPLVDYLQEFEQRQA